MAKKKRKKDLEKKEEKIRSKKDSGKVKEKTKEIKGDKEIQKYFGVLIVGLVIGLIAGVALLSSLSIEKQSTLTADEAGQKAVDWISNFFEAKGQNVSIKLVNATDTKEGVYQIGVEISGKQGEVEQSYYVTKDGELLFPQGIPIGEVSKRPKQGEQQQQNQGQEQKLEIPKTDKPDVKLFIMAYCPYGLQAEKAYLPVYKLLKDNADITVNFVRYAMHEKKELDENLRQYCIQLEQTEKFYDYASCFTGGDGNYTKCLLEAKVDKVKLNSCMARIDEEYNVTGMYNDKSTWIRGKFPMFNVEADLNKKYGVKGSPTFVINSKVVKVGRSPEAIKEAICSAFNNPPKECDQKLSADATSPGFGGGVGSSSSGGCAS